MLIKVIHNKDHTNLNGTYSLIARDSQQCLTKMRFRETVGSMCLYLFTWRRQWQVTPVLLPRKIPWMEEPGRLQSMGLQRVGRDWATSLSLFTFTQWRRQWQPTRVFLPGESQGRQSLVGCRLLGRTVGHDWSDLAVAAAASLHLEHRLLI